MCNVFSFVYITEIPIIIVRICYVCKYVGYISKCLHCCRRRVEFGMMESPLLELSDEDLLQLIRQFQHDYPDVGESVTVGLIRSRGFKVTRARIRNALRSSDPLSAALRWPGMITRRRVYSVAGPNSLWHIGMLQCCTNWALESWLEIC